MNYITGNTIKTLRIKKNLTQNQLANKLGVSDKTISKWENNRGLPDITLIEPLAKVLNVAVTEFLTGEFVINNNKPGNMRKAHFYVCPVCGNIHYTMGESLISCCGVVLPNLESDEEDFEHKILIEKVENEIFVSISHPMEKEHYISFIAQVFIDRMEMVKLYPEGPASARFSYRGFSTIYYYCNIHGLFKYNVNKNSIS